MQSLKHTAARGVRSKVSVSVCPRQLRGACSLRRPSHAGAADAQHEGTVTGEHMIKTVGKVQQCPHAVDLKMQSQTLVELLSTGGPDYSLPSRNLAMELVRVTEAAALAAGRWMGELACSWRAAASQILCSMVMPLPALVPPLC